MGVSIRFVESMGDLTSKQIEAKKKLEKPSKKRALCISQHNISIVSYHILLFKEDERHKVWFELSMIRFPPNKVWLLDQFVNRPFLPLKFNFWVQTYMDHQFTCTFLRISLLGLWNGQEGSEKGNINPHVDFSRESKIVKSSFFLSKYSCTKRMTDSHLVTRQNSFWRWRTRSDFIATRSTERRETGDWHSVRRWWWCYPLFFNVEVFRLL